MFGANYVAAPYFAQAYVGITQFVGGIPIVGMIESVTNGSIIMARRVKIGGVNNGSIRQGRLVTGRLAQPESGGIE